MPNWCSCRATISGPAPVIQEITDILNEESTPLSGAWLHLSEIYGQVCEMS